MKNLEQILSHTLKFQYIHTHLFTSGQPTKDEFEAIKEYGVSVVINLALSTTTGALPYEDQSCLDLGLRYIQLPLDADMPNPEQALFILDTIDFLVRENLVWVHCAENKKVSALMYLYRQYYLGMDLPTAQTLLHHVWEPDDTWTGLMHTVALQLQGRKATEELQASS